MSVSLIQLLADGPGASLEAIEEEEENPQGDEDSEGDADATSSTHSPSHVSHLLSHEPSGGPSVHVLETKTGPTPEEGLEDIEASVPLSPRF